MVQTLSFEEPNLSYVRVNTRVFCPQEGEEITANQKCHITKNMSPADQQVINAALVHKELVAQPQPAPPPVCPVWNVYTTNRYEVRTGTDNPVELWQHLSGDDNMRQTYDNKEGQQNTAVKATENRQQNISVSTTDNSQPQRSLNSAAVNSQQNSSRNTNDNRKQIGNEVKKATVVVRKVAPTLRKAASPSLSNLSSSAAANNNSRTNSLKRSAEESSSGDNLRAVKVLKTSDTNDDKGKLALVNTVDALAEENRRLKLQIMEMQQKMNLMTTVMQDPNKLMSLMKRIQANKSRGGNQPFNNKSSTNHQTISGRA